MGLSTPTRNDVNGVIGNSGSVDGNVKYRLVEAEEVDEQRQQQGQRLNKIKKKGKTNWTQFPIESEKQQQDNDYRPRGRGGRGGRGAWRGRGGGPHGGRHFEKRGVYYNGVYVPNPDKETTAQWAKTQIEYYFTPDNLVRDTFLRQHMDVEGYVPVAFVGSFHAVYSLHQDYASLLEAMKQSEVIELDEQNEKIRLRNGWEKWLWPNAEGGYGVPKYLKSIGTSAEDTNTTNEPESEEATIAVNSSTA